MTTQTQLTTTNELLRHQGDGSCCELIRGELKKMASAGNEHEFLAAVFTGPLITHVRARKLGRIYAAETGFKLATDPDTVRAPDDAFVS